MQTEPAREEEPDLARERELEPAKESEPTGHSGPVQANPVTAAGREPVPTHKPSAKGKGRLPRHAMEQLGDTEDDGKLAAAVATRAFLEKVAVGVSTPLASKPAHPQPQAPTTIASSSAPRRSKHIAKNESSSTVRPSKKGEVLLMRKMGILAPNEPVSEAAHKARGHQRSLPGRHHSLR